MMNFEEGMGVIWNVRDDEPNEEPDYQQGVILQIVDDMLVVARVYPHGGGDKYFDEADSSKSDDYNVQLKSCPPPFDFMCSLSDDYGCFAYAKQDSFEWFTKDEAMLRLDQMDKDGDLSRVSLADRVRVLMHVPPDRRSPEKQKTYIPLSDADVTVGLLDAQKDEDDVGGIFASIAAHAEESDIEAKFEPVEIKPETYVRSEGMQALFRSVADRGPDGKDHSGSSSPSLG